MFFTKTGCLALAVLCITTSLSTETRPKNFHDKTVRESSGVGANRYDINVNLTKFLSGCSERFISLTIDSDLIRRNWTGFDFNSTRLHTLARGLAPTDIRIGGTEADYLTFVPNPDLIASHTHGEWIQTRASATKETRRQEYDFMLTGAVWKSMTTFFKNVEWDLIFDLNQFKRNGTEWDYSNAALMLNYSMALGIHIPYFQLGNEPNLYKGENVITPERFVNDYKQLRKLLKLFYGYYDGALVFGPGVTNLEQGSSSFKYLKGFLEAGGYDVVDEIGVHHYYNNGATAKVEDFLSTKLMDTLKAELDLAKILIWTASPKDLPLRLSETSSCYGGGAPGISDRFVAGFLWLDKLGIAAKYGLTRVFRQEFYGGNYALVSNHLEPNPDYYLSVLYKRMVRGPVFNVTVSGPNNDVRVYAHCANDNVYSSGAVVLYYLNVGSSQGILHPIQFIEHNFDLYIFTAGDNDGLTSKSVKLNGQVLTMPNDMMLPPMDPIRHQGEITVEPQSFGFVVVTNARMPICV